MEQSQALSRNGTAFTGLVGRGETMPFGKSQSGDSIEGEEGENRRQKNGPVNSQGNPILKLRL